MRHQDYSSIQNFEVHENSEIALYDESNPEILYMEQEAFQYIKDSGVPVFVYTRVNDLGKIDSVWEEDSDPLYDNPIPVYGQYVPEAMSVVLKKWGVDAQTQFLIHFSRANLLAVFGNRLIRQGDVIEIPHNTLVQTQNTEFIDGPFGCLDKFRVISAKDTGNYNYRWLYWTCTVEVLSSDISVKVE
jgi:hypothetical protein